MIKESTKIIEAVYEIFESDINHTKEMLYSSDLDKKYIADLFIDCLYELISRQTWRIMQKTFVYEFHEFRKSKSLPISKTSSRAYDMFIAQLNTEVVKCWFKKYKILQKIMNAVINNSCEYVKEVYSRYICDSNLLVRNGFTSVDTQLVKVYPLNSDPHNKGKVVLMFEDSVHNMFIYKERDFAIDNLISEIFDGVLCRKDYKCNPIPPSINRDGYGWQKFIKKAPIKREFLSDAFYNLGYVSALFSVIGTTDLHEENIIFDGLIPYFIDLETAIRPNFGEKDHSLIEEMKERIEKALPQTMILPSKLMDNMYDYLVGAINTPYRQESKKAIFTMKNVGTDAIDISREIVTFERLDNPIICEDKNIIDPILYQKDFIKGYKVGFEMIVTNRIEIINLFKNFHGKLRMVLRPTAQYYLLMDAVLFPENLVDYESTKRILRYLKPISFIKDKTLSEKIYYKECSSLLEGDIPYFSFCSNDTFLSINKELFYNVFDTSANVNSINRLSQLTEDWLKLEQFFISEGFAEIKIRNEKHNNYYHNNSPLFTCLFKNLENFEINSIFNWWKSLSISFSQSGKTIRSWLNGSYGDIPIMYNTYTFISFHDVGGISLMLRNLEYFMDNNESSRLLVESIDGIRELKKAVYGKYSGDYVSIIAGSDSLEYIFNAYDTNNLFLEKSLTTSEYTMGDVFNGKLGVYLALSTYLNSDNKLFIDALSNMNDDVNKYSKFGIAHGFLGELWTKFRIYAKLNDISKCYDIYEETLKNLSLDTELDNGWCSGRAGLLMILVEMAAFLGINRDFFSVAKKCTNLSNDNPVDLSICHGTSGIIQSFVFCYIVSNDNRYLQLAEEYICKIYSNANKNGFYTGERNREYILGYILGWSGIIDSILILRLAQKGNKPWIPINLSCYEYQKKLQRR